MSYRIPASFSLESLLRYVNSVQAGLSAMEELAEQLEPWKALRQKLRQARDERDDAEATLDAAEAKVRVEDTRWDHALGELSGEAFLLSGKDAKAEPYLSLFGSLTATEAKDLGAYRASAFGDQTLLKLYSMSLPRLAESTALFEMANTRLKAAAEARTDAENKALLHASARRKLLHEVEEQAARTEVAILSKFLGRRDLVRAILAPPRPKSSSKKDEEPTPAGQDSAS